MITNSYEELFSWKNIYAAHLKSRASRRGKKPIIRFEFSTLSNIYELHTRLLKGTFKFSGYNTFIVYEPKKREIQNMRYCDRVIQHVLSDEMLTPYFSKRVIYDNCVCQKGKGSHFALGRFENMIRKFIRKHGVKGYFLKCDVLKYFASIPHEKLKEVICTRIVDERIRKMIEGIIDGYSTNAEFLKRYGIEPLKEGANTGRGVPIGNQTSQIFGMFYLDPVDRLIKEKLRIKVYSRYMDDFVLMHEDLEYLKYVKDSITQLVNSLGLQLNSKTQIFPIKNGVTYLGYRYRVTAEGKIVKTIKKATKRRFRWRAKLIKKGYLEGLANVERVRQTCAAFHGYMKHARSIKFAKELENTLAPIEEIEKQKQEKKEELMQKYTEREFMDLMMQMLDDEIIKEMRNKAHPAEAEDDSAVDDGATCRISRKPFRIKDFDVPKDKEMAVFTAAKKLSEYLFVITRKSPKALRWNIVSRLLDTSTEIIRILYRANFSEGEQRIENQKEALAQLNILDFYAETAKINQAIDNHQMEVLSKAIYETKKLLNGWISSEKNRLKKNNNF